jgi:isopropylmalate/homocitrate/citramalate synthase
MSIITIQINENSEAGIAFKQMIAYFKNQAGIKVIEEKSNEDSPYDSEFVEKILKRSRNLKKEKTTRLNPDDIWGSIL